MPEVPVEVRNVQAAIRRSLGPEASPNPEAIKAALEGGAQHDHPKWTEQEIVTWHQQWCAKFPSVYFAYLHAADKYALTDAVAGRAMDAGAPAAPTPMDLLKQFADTIQTLEGRIEKLVSEGKGNAGAQARATAAEARVRELEKQVEDLKAGVAGPVPPVVEGGPSGSVPKGTAAAAAAGAGKK